MDKHNIVHPDEGVIGMKNMLLDHGYLVNHKRVRRLMQEMNIKAIYPQKNLTKFIKGQHVYPYLLRNLEITHPNHVWSTDITYIAMEKGFMYLVAIIDVFSRCILGWTVSNSLDAWVSVDLLEQTIAKHGKPDIVNSDQGSQYTSNSWIQLLKNNDIDISMDGKGRATDNIWIERFWRTIKRGYIYLYPATDGLMLFKGIEKYINYYNSQRRHSAIFNKKPQEYYYEYFAIHGKNSITLKNTKYPTTQIDLTN
jgi:putative transposase